MIASTNPPTWFLTKINGGLQSFLPLALESQPATDLLGVMVQTWATDLWPTREWRLATDAVVIDQVFTELRRVCIRWPSMKLFSETLDGFASKPAAPYHQPFPKALNALEWNKNRGNKSTIAKAHATYNCGRLGLPVPEWCMPNNDAESTAILRVIEGIRDEQKQLCRNNGIAERATSPAVGANQGGIAADSRVPDVAPDGVRAERDSGHPLEERDAERPAVEGLSEFDACDAALDELFDRDWPEAA